MPDPYEIDQPSWAEILRKALDRRLASMHTAMPGVVKSYDAAKQTATVQPAVQVDGKNLPPLEDVPVAWQRGGGYFAAFPLTSGDTGLLVFSESDFSQWRVSGGEVSPPFIQKRHGLYAWFIPGGVPDGNELADASDSVAVIGKDGGPRIQIDGSEIKLGTGDPSDFVALASKVDALWDAFVNAVPGGTDGGAAIQTAVKLVYEAQDSTTAAEEVKAK